MKTFLLEIVTPEKVVYSHEVETITVKGVEGELGILPNHVPLVTALTVAPMKVKRAGSKEVIAINGGFMEVRKDKVVVLAETAELPGDINIDRAKAAKMRAEQRLKDGRRDEVDYARAELALKRALNRIGVGENTFL